MFTITSQSSETRARCGILDLGHGSVETPVFMPVGTQGAIKGMLPKQLLDLDFTIMLSNTYHLYLRPGPEVIKPLGLHKFSTWHRNFLTDSGGYQVFSLAHMRKILEEGVKFQSHIDGSKHLLTPETVLDIQGILGSDIAMVLDVCTAPDISEKKALSALITTSKWAKKSIEHRQAHPHPYQKVFGIVQGNFYKDLRARSAEEITALDFDGIAIGGLSVGEDFETYCDILSYTSPLIPDHKAKYVMGIGTLDYILEAVEQGIDMFDSVYPTRIARNGSFLTWEGRLTIGHSRYKNDYGPIMEESPIADFSKAFLAHAFRAKEMIGPMLATIHNLWFMKEFMNKLRASIREDCFAQFKEQVYEVFSKK